MTTPLGEYLRARREQTRPEDVGVATTSARRVPGLRRDEVARLAGISTEYYTRLEQGRDRRPSAQVLDAVARVLGMDAAAASHLHDLAEHTTRTRRPPRRVERVRPGIVSMVDALAWPAWIEGRYLDVLHANPLAQRLSPLFAPGSNLLRSTVEFASDSAHSADITASIPGLVGQLRWSAGSDPDDPRLAELVGDLAVRSDDFARAWARHDVQKHPGSGTYAFEHPELGDLDVAFEKFRVVGADDQVLVMCRPEPASPTADAFALLATLVATETNAVSPRPGTPSRS